MLDFTSWNYKNAPTAGDYCCPPSDDECEYGEMSQEECDAEMAAGVEYFEKMAEFVKTYNLAGLKTDWMDDPYWWNLWVTQWA